MSGSQLLIPSLGLPLTTKSLAAVSIPKEGIQGRGGHILVCEMPTGVISLGTYLTLKAEAEYTLQRVMDVGWPYLVCVGELLIVALLGTLKIRVLCG